MQVCLFNVIKGVQGLELMKCMVEMAWQIFLKPILCPISLWNWHLNPPAFKLIFLCNSQDLLFSVFPSASKRGIKRQKLVPISAWCRLWYLQVWHKDATSHLLQGNVHEDDTYRSINNWILITNGMHINNWIYFHPSNRNQVVTLFGFRWYSDLGLSKT